MTVVKKIPSSSNPHKAYDICMGNNGHFYCTCPAWKNQKNVPPQERSCKHLRQYIAESGLPRELATRPSREES